MLQAGVAQTDITPPVGIELTGFISRQQPSLGVHDPLFAKAIAFDDKKTKVVLVSCDLLALSRESTNKIRTMVFNQTKILPQNILISCTHTHSGPATVFLRNCGTVDQTWLAKLENQIVDVILESVWNMQPVKLGFGIGTADMSLDRRVHGTTPVSKEPKVDKTLGVIKVESAAGDPIAVLLNYTCHPVVMAEKNRELSADFPGAVANYIESSYPSQPIVFYTNGACGNVNPVVRGGTWNDVTRLGELIGKEAVTVLDSIQTTDALPISAVNRNIELQVRLPNIAGIEHELTSFRDKAVEIPPDNAIAQRGTAAMIWWAEETLDILKKGTQPDAIPVEIQVIKLGDPCLVGIGGEVFCEIGLNIKQRAKYPTFVIGYANHDIGYIPTRKAFTEGGYEICSAYRFYGNFMITPDAQHAIESTAVHLVNSI